MMEPSAIPQEDIDEWENNSQISYDDFYLMLNCPVLPLDQHVNSIANILVALVEENNSITIENTIFNSIQIPNISIHNYLKRIHEFSICSRESYI